MAWDLCPAARRTTALRHSPLGPPNGRSDYRTFAQGGAESRPTPVRRYVKYHFAKSIAMQRVRCRCCGTTHALIPLFSVPSTSLGREEAARCLNARREGASRSAARTELVLLGMEERSGGRLERKLATAVERAKAIWPQAADARFSPHEWIRIVSGSTAHPIAEMNRRNGWTFRLLPGCSPVPTRRRSG